MTSHRGKRSGRMRARKREFGFFPASFLGQRNRGNELSCCSLCHLLTNMMMPHTLTIRQQYEHFGPQKWVSVMAILECLEVSGWQANRFGDQKSSLSPFSLCSLCSLCFSVSAPSARHQLDIFIKKWRVQAIWESEKEASEEEQKFTEKRGHE